MDILSCNMRCSYSDLPSYSVIIYLKLSSPTTNVLAPMLLFILGFLALVFECRWNEDMDRLPPGYELTAAAVSAVL